MSIVPKISTSKFKPLDLNEIMMVPLAKQKMEDEVLAGTEKFGSLTSNVLDVDSEKATNIINSFKNRASGISDDVLSHGVSRSQINKLKALRGETNNEMSSGFVGKAMANKKSAAEYIQALATKKERQAGYSAKHARQWALAHVGGDEKRGIAGFKGTQNDDGSFNSFSGKELDTKVDEDKFIKEAVDSVEGKVSKTAMKLIRVGNLPAFTRAFQQKKISGTDYNAIMDAILTKSMTSPDLLAHLKQQAFFTGEEDPFDLGEFNYTKDENGNTIRTFVPGKSRYGRKMAGFGRAAANQSVDIEYKFLKDDLGLYMHKKGMEKQDALDVISFNRGEMSNYKAANLEQTQKNIDLYGEEAKKYLGLANKRKEDLREKGVSEGKILEDREYKRLNNLYIDNNTTFHNSKHRMNAIFKEVDGQMSDNDKAIFATQDLLDKYNGDAIRVLREEYGIEVSKKWLARGYQRSEDAEAHNILASKMGVNMNAPGLGRADINTFPFILKSAKEKRIELSEEYLEANPTANYFTRLNGESTGKYATVIGRINARDSKFFQVQGQSLAFGGGQLKDSEEFADLGTSDKGFDYRVELTDGTDDSGDHFDNVIITNKEDGTSASFQVVNNERGSDLNYVGSLLANSSDYNHRKTGTQMLADQIHMRNIKKSGLYSQSEGDIALSNLFTKKTKEKLSAKYVKTKSGDGTPYWVVTINGVDISDGQPLYGENEISVALYKFINTKVKK